MIIGNRYQIQDEIGAGGMGTVYKGFDTYTQQPVAIKQLKSEVAQTEILERFKREGEALRELNHPNIVKFLDALEHEQQHYLILEYVDGGDLNQRLKHGDLTVETILRFAIDLADALTRAHKLNIIHRDLKPANVLIGADGILRLTDFGVAHIVNKARVTEADVLVGTLDYIAPEVLDGSSIDARADIWAFGVILFEMLSGQRPFTGRTYTEIIMAILHHPLPDLEQLAPHAPIALIDLVYRMLERDPYARISSVRHVGAQLEDILEERGQITPVPTRFETPIVDFRQRPKHNLPVQITPFVGRETEVSELARLLEKPNIRLISILAQGGMGKTRLSLEVAEQQIPFFADGVYFVELAPLSTIEQIISAIATALNYQFPNDARESKQQLFDFLAPKHLLLVMDNYEHVLDGAGLVSELLQSAPQIKIMATSRQRLDQAGETIFHLSGMDFPTWETPADALDYAAVKLFMNSATRAKPDFTLDAHHLEAVARICKLVQGMPLGIVLSASWLSMLSPQEIADELKQNLDLLDSDSQHIPARQRSMRVVMDYSWQQMNADEQNIFMKLSVFRGGFTREAAEKVADAHLRTLMSLVNKSLLRRNLLTGRYEIHELLRQYAEGQLRTLALFDIVQETHAHYFSQWLVLCERALLSKQGFEAIQNFENEYLNIESAWNWAIDHADDALTMQMLRSLTVAFLIIQKMRKPSQFFTDTSERITQEPLKSQIMLRAILFDVRGDSYQIAKATIMACFTQLKSLDNPFENAFRQYTNALYAIFTERNYKEGEVILSEAMHLFETLGEKWWLAQTYQTLGFLQMISGEKVAISQHSTQIAYNIYQEMGATLSGLSLINNLALNHFYKGEIGVAYKLVSQLNQERRQYHWQGAGMMFSLANEARFLAFQGFYNEAQVLYQEALALSIDHQNMDAIFNNYLFLVENLAYLQRFDEAKSLLEKAKTIFSDDLGIALIASYSGFIEYCRGNYPVALNYVLQAYQLIENIAEHMVITTFQIELGLYQVKMDALDQARQNLLQALSATQYLGEKYQGLYGIAELAYRQGDTEWAVELATALTQSQALHHAFKMLNQDLLVAWQATMPQDVYDRAVARGKTLDLPTVIEELLAEFSNANPTRG